MVRKKRSPRAAESELSKLTSSEKSFYVAKWKAMLAEEDQSKRTLNLHAVMCQVNRLKTKHNESSVVAALKVVYPDRSTRTRLQRLHEIPPAELEKAMTDFRNAKKKDQGDARSWQTLSTTHLEALARCTDARKRLQLLRECAKAGWTATELRKKVVDKSADKEIRLTKLATQIHLRSTQLAELLESTESGKLLGAVDNVKKGDLEKAILELGGAVITLDKLKHLVIDRKTILNDAKLKLDQRPKPPDK